MLDIFTNAVLGGSSAGWIGWSKGRRLETILHRVRWLDAGVDVRLDPVGYWAVVALQ